MYNEFLDLEEPAGPNLVYVWPVPYQGTVSFAAGTKEAPAALLRASYEIETFDPELGVDISELCRFQTQPFQRPNVAGPEHLYRYMENTLTDFDPGRDFILTLGGEHSVALPLIRFYARMHPELTVLQVDAHADLRPSFQGSPYSHACIMSRVRDLGIRFVSLGVRSMDRDESQWIQNNPERVKALHPWDLPGPEQAAKLVREFIGQGPVYITFDADGLDPSIMPGTGTPEPGGLDYYWLGNFWKNLWPGPRLVGMDLCEVAPQPGSVLSESVGVKCILKVLMNYFRNT